MIMLLNELQEKKQIKMNKTKTLHLETQKIQQEKHLKKIRENFLIKTKYKIMKKNQMMKKLYCSQKE